MEISNIIRVKVLDGYRLRLRFDDLATRTVDLKSVLWGPMFSPLLKRKEFKKVRVNAESGTIEWPNGADICPEYLRGPNKLGRNIKYRRKVMGMNKADKVLAKRLKCRRFYKLKVKSKKTGKWEMRMYSCNLDSLETAVGIYKKRFGDKAKIVKVRA